MDFIQLKIKKDDSMTEYITIIRKLDYSLSAETIRRRIDKLESYPAQLGAVYKIVLRDQEEVGAMWDRSPW